MIDWTIVLAVLGLLFAGTALLYKYVPPRISPIPPGVAELNGLISVLRGKLDAQNVVISIWKERGDKYSNHNDVLQQEIQAANNTIRDIMCNPDLLSAYKSMAEKLASGKASSK